MYQELVTVVDDFFESPMDVRACALRQAYADPPSQLDPKTIGPIAKYTACDQATRDITLDKLRRLIPGEISRALIEYRYCHQRTIKRVVCHADGIDYAGVVYLSLPEHCQGGTWFFRHRPTDSLMSRQEHHQLYDYFASDAWEKTYDVSMAFNRLVLYPGDLFHAIASPYFGDSVENARLTLTFFVSMKQPLDLQALIERAKHGRGVQSQAYSHITPRA